MHAPTRLPAAVRRPLTVPLLVAALLVAACSGSASPTIPPGATGSTVPAATATPVPSPSPSASPTPGATSTFPVSLTDDEGTDVRIPSEPQHIVSLTPAATETLFAIGAGPRTVARVEDVADYPPAAHDLPVVATFTSVDVERIVGLHADLVIAGGNGFNPPDAIARLRSLDIPVLVVYAADLDGVFADIGLIGQAVGEASAAADLVAAMRAGFDQVGAATAGLDRPRTFYEIDATNAIYGPARDSFLEAMIAQAGGDPITTGSPTAYQISLETLVTADPQVIILGDAAYGVTPQVVAARSGWGAMTAVKTNAIRPIDDVIVTRPGPRLVDGLRALALAIHPGLALPSEPPVPGSSPAGASPAPAGASASASP